MQTCNGSDLEAFRVTAVGHDSRIDLRWEPAEDNELLGYFVYRSSSENGPFLKLHRSPYEPHVYSDFIGENGKTFYYRVGKALAGRPKVEELSAIVSAGTAPMSDEQLLTSVQQATFRYFWDHAHRVSGLAFERGRTGRLPQKGRFRACTSGGTGFGLMAIMIGAERGFVPRERAASRVLKMVTFLQEKSDRFHGAWPHWLDGESGKTIPFSPYDDGADLVETSFLIQGMLTIRSYFDRNDTVETEIRRRVTQLWHEVEWDFFLQHSDSKRLYWHWSPQHQWKINLAIVGYNECMIAYLLAIASPTHPITADCYDMGWASSPRYENGDTHYGHKQWVGKRLGGPLFWTHYSFVGFDPRGKRDRFCDYFENNRNIAQIHRDYCIENPEGHKGYSEVAWGLTASDVQDGYRANAPGRDDGTIAPTAAISSMPYTPEESLAALKHFYHEYGDRLWGEYGFRDAFNLDLNWFADSYIAIDQGPIICMIENHRTQLCWRMFMSAPEIAPMLRSIGWRRSISPRGQPQTRQ
jgi:hypothetical protein